MTQVEYHLEKTKVKHSYNNNLETISLFETLEKVAEELTSQYGDRFVVKEWEPALEDMISIPTFRIIKKRLSGFIPGKVVVETTNGIYGKGSGETKVCVSIKDKRYEFLAMPYIKKYAEEHKVKHLVVTYGSGSFSSSF